MTCHVLPLSIFWEYTSNHNVFLKSSNLSYITINDEPASRILALTSSKLCNDASLKLFVHAVPFLPEDTSTRWQTCQPQEKMKAGLKAAASLEGQGTNLQYRSTPQHIRDKALLPKQSCFTALNVGGQDVCLRVYCSLSSQDKTKDFDYMAEQGQIRLCR